MTVEGAVKKPGVYALKGKNTLLQALALAEGINDVGDSAVTLIRVSDQRRVSAKFDVAAIRSGQVARSVGLWRRHDRGRRIPGAHRRASHQIGRPRNDQHRSETLVMLQSQR